MAALMMSLTAQAEAQDVGGRVIDQNGEPLGFVSVALLSADSTYIQGAMSDENGAFMIQTTDACCILRLSFIGYRTQYVDIKGTDVGTIQSGKWLKMHFEGGMKAFQEQYEKFHKEWMPAHPEYKWVPNSCSMEWYQGTDIESPDYQCGVIMPIE